MSLRFANRSRLCVAACLAFFGWSLPDVVVAQETLYSTIDLGVRTAEQVSFARKVNSRGEVVGRSGGVNGTETRATVWTAGGLEVLGVLPGGDYSAAHGINDFGVVVGSSNTGTIVRPFKWISGQGMRPLPTLASHRGGEALAINNNGDAVGYLTGVEGAMAVLWTSDERIVRIGALPGAISSRAVAINRSGQVAGTSRSAKGKRAFTWTAQQGLRDLGTLPGDTESEALDINDAGYVVGASTGRNGTSAFLWTPSTGMVRLRTLGGGNYSRATGINNKGEIVGTSTSPAGSRAVVWAYNGAVRDVHTMRRPALLGMVLSEAQAISDSSQIVALSGGGEHADDKDHTDHFYHVYMLKR
jgi:probable HAF family extracellular repeat protein